MPRQHYETSVDLARELALAKRLAKVLGMVPQKVSERLYDSDFVMFLSEDTGIPGNIGTPKYWIEIKCRGIASTDYSHYMTSLSKMHRLTNAGNISENIRAMLVVQFTDIIMWCSSTSFFVIGMGKRGEMRDEMDCEPMAFIPITQFRRIGVEP